ncbi:MAG: hypothetical protein JHC31_15920 [Sulfurihydrogenibium sp.]|jgi:hypothetical protein|nr:hypothetical protein [Sulfurihydrogenibium sp.]
METSTFIQFFLYLTTFLAFLLVITNITNPLKTKYKFKLNQTKRKKKKYSNINIYNTIDQEFKEKIIQCLNLHRITTNKKECINLKEIIEKDKKLHQSITNRLTKIEEKIVKQIANNQDNNIDIKSKITETLDSLIYLINNKNEIKNKITETFDNLLHLIFPNRTKSEAVKIFHDILSITILREHIFSNTKELKDKYTDFLILLLYIKSNNPSTLYTNQELKEAFELEKEEMILLEKIEFIKTNKLPSEFPTLIETIERFANISKLLFESFDELYLACMPKHIAKGKNSKSTAENTENNNRKNTNNNSNTNNENNNETTNENKDQSETTNKYRVII